MSFNSGVIEGISVVTTTWNEEGNIEELIHRIRSTLQNAPHEIIVVDDSSSDRTFEVADALLMLQLEKFERGKPKHYCMGPNLPSFR